MVSLSSAFDNVDSGIKSECKALQVWSEYEQSFYCIEFCDVGTRILLLYVNLICSGIGKSK